MCVSRFRNYICTILLKPAFVFSPLDLTSPAVMICNLFGGTISNKIKSGYKVIPL